MVISKEPLAPAVADGDPPWSNAVRSIVFSLIQGEEFGINSQNIATFADSKDKGGFIVFSSFSLILKLCFLTGNIDSYGCWNNSKHGGSSASNFAIGVNTMGFTSLNLNFFAVKSSHPR